MQSVKTWIFETDKLHEVPGSEMNVIFNQVDNNTVGIRAGNMFTLSYGIIAQVNFGFGSGLNVFCPYGLRFII